MIDHGYDSFHTAPYVARQLARQLTEDRGDSCTPDEAFTAIRLDMLLGRLPPGSYGCMPDAAFRQRMPADEYPWITYKVQSDGVVRTVPDESPEFIELTPALVLRWLASAPTADPVAKRWEDAGISVEDACRQVANSPVPAIGEPGREVNESLGLTDEGVRAIYNRRGMTIPAWAAESVHPHEPPELPHRPIAESTEAAPPAPPGELTSQPVDVSRTGMAGRPTSKDLILAELESRAGRGVLRRTLTAESEQLCSWLAATHPGAPQPKTKTVENSIRGQYRDLIKAHPPK